MTDIAAKKRTPLSIGSEWRFDLIEKYDREIARVAEGYKLDTYPNQIEIISAEQMMDAYASNGMPLGYHHWSFGKRFLSTEMVYKRGAMGLAYEIVINANPCIAYLMEENTMAMQALVIAHASYGHNSFFKGNHLFRTWTHADAIIDYLAFAKQYITECEQRYGVEEVERTLDACHALMNFAVDRYKRPPKRSAEQEKARHKEREEHLQLLVNELWRTLPKLAEEKKEDGEEFRFPPEPAENIMYFLEKHSPLLEPWQREIARIVRKVAQYFYPQRQTQVMNEGWATFWHYTLINDLYDEGLIADSMLLEILHSHTNVITQPSFDSPYYSGFNPYALGFAMYRDIRRVCEGGVWEGGEFKESTDEILTEDRAWFPDHAGMSPVVDGKPTNLWPKTLDYAMRNFKDESFISQFLSPKLIRDFRMFCLIDDSDSPSWKIGQIHNDEGYREVRSTLSEQYALSEREPNIQVYNVDVAGDRSLTLRHFQSGGKPLAPDFKEVMKHLGYLWGFNTRLETQDESGNVEETFKVKMEKRQRRGKSPHDGFFELSPSRWRGK
jgi:stage V sporulation protein R